MAKANRDAAVKPIKIDLDSLVLSPVKGFKRYNFIKDGLLVAEECDYIISMPQTRDT